METPNDPKLRGGGPESALTEQGGARRRRGLCMVGGKVAGEAQPVTEPGGRTAAPPKLTARPAVTCSAWLGFCVSLSQADGNRRLASARLAQASDSDNSGVANLANRDRLAGLATPELSEPHACATRAEAIMLLPSASDNETPKPNHALQPTAPRVTVAAILRSCPSRPSHIIS